MTAKKRKPRIVTEATKAKLPKPRTRKPKAVGTMPDEFYDNRDLTGPHGPRPRTRRPLPDLSIVGLEPAPDFLVVPVPSITNAEYLRGGKPGTGAQVPCMDWPADSLPSGVRVTDAAMLEMEMVNPDPWRGSRAGMLEMAFYGTSATDVPPNVEPYPWPLRVLEWVDGRIVAARTRVAAWLRALSRKVAP